MSEYQKEILRLDDGDLFIAHLCVHQDTIFGGDPHTATAEVYDANEWEKIDKSARGVSYASGTIGGEMYDEFNDDCRLMFVLRVQYRGCWDERTYPKDEEYWDGELAKMAEAEALLRPKLQDLIRAVNELAADDKD